MSRCRAILTIILVLQLAHHTLGSPASDLRQIRELLTTLFHKYSSEMQSLRLSVKGSERRFEGLESKLMRKISQVEDMIGRRQRDVHTKGLGGTRIPFDLEERLVKLEDLTRLNAARTCHELKMNGLSRSGTYFLNPNQGHIPAQVHCEMETGTTRIDHDTVGQIRVSSCHEPGCFVRRIRYGLSLRQISDIMALSKTCEQHFRECGKI